MITSSFQLLSQVMRLSYFPHIKMVHTSKYFHGQIYIPMANWLLMIGTVIVTAVYNNVSPALFDLVTLLVFNFARKSYTLISVFHQQSQVGALYKLWLSSSLRESFLRDYLHRR